MWRRAYLLLVLVRLYFALSPSYLHPDEHFQGPEVIAGQIFSYPVHLTWEFTSAQPIRSAFPLWPVYGLPMWLLRSVWIGRGDNAEVAPPVVFWTLRILMFVLSFVLEDWAIHELVSSPRHRRLAVLLVASSYVTWTFQTHTFSNSVETLLVAWSLVLIQRIIDNKQRSSTFASGVLGFLVVFGIFNRITFPAFLIIPGLRIIPHFFRKPFALSFFFGFAILTTLLAIFIDTEFYAQAPLTISSLIRNPVITPLNNFMYNLESTNLAEHGLHPYYQHFAANLPQLLGPAYLLLFISPRFTLRIASAISGVVILSLFQHQEARFLIPAVPLVLSSVQIPKVGTRAWVAAWIGFNVTLGIFMGSYHQGGVVPTQFFMAGQEDGTQALWWRTYSPPIWLLDGMNSQLKTTDLMGMRPDLMIKNLRQALTCGNSTDSISGPDGIYLIAPLSSTFLDPYTSPGGKEDLHLEQIWLHKSHLNLDDMDFPGDGVWATLKRVLGRRGLAAWKATKYCP